MPWLVAVRVGLMGRVLERLTTRRKLPHKGCLLYFCHVGSNGVLRELNLYEAMRRGEVDNFF